jgi:hypothetical protein
MRSASMITWSTTYPALALARLSGPIGLRRPLAPRQSSPLAGTARGPRSAGGRSDTGAPTSNGMDLAPPPRPPIFAVRALPDGRLLIFAPAPGFPVRAPETEIVRTGPDRSLVKR